MKTEPVTAANTTEADRWALGLTERIFAGRTGHGQTAGVVYLQMRRPQVEAIALESYISGQCCEETRLALAACKELIFGDGTAQCTQRTIDLARKALRLPVS